MVPYSFASTSHFSLTFFISFTVVLGATILGFIKHGLKFFSLFVPAGCPLALLPLLVLIEFISYLARNVSLGLRLAANILSGHMLLNILSGFAYNIITSAFIYFFIGLTSLAFILAFLLLTGMMRSIYLSCPWWWRLKLPKSSGIEIQKIIGKIVPREGSCDVMFK